MHWKEQLRILEEHDDFDVAIFFMEKVIEAHPHDVEAYLFMLFRLMDTMIEQACHFSNVSITPVSEIKIAYYNAQEERYHKLVKQYFDIAYEKLSQNAEFLFYGAKIASISCGLSTWYLGIDADFIINMMEKAALLNPDNIVYQWTHYIKVGDKNPKDTKLLQYIQNIFEEGSTLRKLLKEKGSLGEYILELMQYWTRGVLGVSK